ncbi:hypothetical protein [Nocardia sp. NPDC059228]|uniref:hypothetical protein n=1 Tax=Nocardia sp. NPDC059228 TaxID=3346777 RepID=UPI003675D904
MIWVRMVGLALVVVGFLACAGCGTHDGGPSWFSPNGGRGTEKTHVFIQGGTVRPSRVTLRVSYRCPSSTPKGGVLTAQIGDSGSTGLVHRDPVPVTCDGSEHGIDVDFEESLPAGEARVLGIVALWLPAAVPDPAGGAVSPAGALSSVQTQDVANDLNGKVELEAAL